MTIELEKKRIRILVKSKPYPSKRPGSETISKISTISELKTYAVGLLHKHSLDDWKILFNNSMNCMSRCLHDTQSILLSRYLLKLTNEELVDTILHEIAHAIVGPEAGHTLRWKEIAQKIGCSGEIYINAKFIKYKHTVGCTNCAYSIGRHRLDRRFLENYVCPKCSGSLEEK